MKLTMVVNVDGIFFYNEAEGKLNPEKDDEKAVLVIDGNMVILPKDKIKLYGSVVL